jgi:uroporphyrin-III C-methyltransferase / precorrin-2 dehydrogenase / sirohydrochlorin ferrochelatase
VTSDEPAIRSPEPRSPILFPIFLKLEGRPCLVVGAGTVGESKIEGLLAAGARVRVVAPRATEAVAELARTGKVVWEARGFEPADLDGAFLVIVATASRELNEWVFQEAERRGVVCNVVDDPPHCDFYYPAVVRRGALQIAISTGGHSPALAQRLKREIEEQLPPEYEQWVEELGRKRRRLFRRAMDPERRRGLLHRLAARERFAKSGFGVRGSGFGKEKPGLRVQPSGLGTESSVAPASDRWSDGAQSAPLQPIWTPLPRTPNPEPRTPKVYLVAAGPGDPDLLTVKAQRILGEADVVLHDDLVTAAIIERVSPRASVFSVGKRCGPKNISQEEINSTMIAYARSGLRVARLQGGDPLIFGRAGEEIRALRAAGVDFEIVPGVTAPLGAAAAAGIALTERGVASSVVFLTGHHSASRARSELGWPASIRPDATVVVYMPGDDYAGIAAELCARGCDFETACLIVSGASTAREQTHLTTLRELPSAPRLPSPRLLIVGAVAARAVTGSRDSLLPTPDLAETRP